MNKIEPTVTSTPAEAISLLDFFKTKKPAVRSVSDILGGVTSLIDELKGVVAFQNQKVAENEDQIQKLAEENLVCMAEAEKARAAAQNIQKMIGVSDE